MRIHLPNVQILTIAYLLLAAIGAAAQGPSAGTITGRGTVEWKRTPEVLRVQVEVQAKAKDLKEALTRLKERREAAQKNLEMLGALPASVEFSEAIITEEKSDQQKMMEMMVGGRAQAKKPNQKAKQAPPIVVSATLKAEVPLKAAGPEELLVLAHVLEEKIKGVDLGGLKELKQLSPQDEEGAEEAPQGAFMVGMGIEGTELKRGEPTFLYVSKVSEEDQTKALAEAFQKAKRAAGRVARAAGVELGAMHHVDDVTATMPEEGASVNEGIFSIYTQLLQQGRQAPKADRPHSGEATGLQPGKVTYRVAIAAAFTFKPTANK
jgi:hypothetical protein